MEQNCKHVSLSEKESAKGGKELRKMGYIIESRAAYCSVCKQKTVQYRMLNPNKRFRCSQKYKQSL